MTRSELVAATAKRFPHLSDGDARLAVDALFEALSEALVRGEKIELRGFGSFRVKTYKAREGKNPMTGETVFIMTRRQVQFKVGKDLGERIQIESPDTSNHENGS